MRILLVVQVLSTIRRVDVKSDMLLVRIYMVVTNVV